MVQGVRIREGATELLVPEQHSSGGPGKIFDTVFFNELTRTCQINMQSKRKAPRHRNQKYTPSPKIFSPSVPTTPPGIKRLKKLAAIDTTELEKFQEELKAEKK